MAPNEPQTNEPTSQKAAIPPSAALAAGAGDATASAARERLCVAAEHRYEAASKLCDDAAGLREQIGQVFPEPGAIIHELARLREDLDKAQVRLAALALTPALEAAELDGSDEEAATLPEPEAKAARQLEADAERPRLFRRRKRP